MLRKRILELLLESKRHETFQDKDGENEVDMSRRDELYGTGDDEETPIHAGESVQDDGRTRVLK